MFVLLIAIFFYKFFIKPEDVSTAQIEENSSEGEGEGEYEGEDEDEDEGEDEGESENEDDEEGEEGEEEDEVLYFRAVVVRKYVRVNYISYSYIVTPLAAFIFYKIIIKGEQNAQMKPDSKPVNVSVEERNSDEERSSYEEISSDEESGSEDENVDEEFIHFRALLVRKYARVNYVRRE
ncbi:hypothetical protein Glove_219g7 [Diversispora epigaea]|uniref:Uncharacterized protein n=1 Tax=Diversispora epigaea TaxID=1348612 RepID=A0A397IFY8_9GLOM|nr:hypothetical protein Glove_219g7 [Diversispora epigaea]